MYTHDHDQVSECLVANTSRNIGREGEGESELR